MVSACSERPLPGESAGESTTTGPDVPATTTELPATTTGLPPTTSGEPPTTSGEVTTAVTTTATTGEPATCGPPCPATMVIDGDLDVGANPGDYTCVTEVHGLLRIDASADPAVVATLANVKVVHDRLTIGEQPGLTDLSTFACLERVDQLFIHDMPQLADLSALAEVEANWVSLDNLGITQVPVLGSGAGPRGTIFLLRNAALTDLSPMKSWDPVLKLDLEGSPGITDLGPLAGPLGEPERFYNVVLADLPGVTSLAGLEALTDIENLQLVNLPGITDLAPLAKLTKTRSLSLLGLPNLSALTGLGALTRVESALNLGHCSKEGMDGLVSLAGLDALNHVGAFSIAHCDALTSLDGAPLLGHVNSLRVSSNPQLSQEAFDAFVAAIASVPGSCFNICECQ